MSPGRYELQAGVYTRDDTVRLPRPDGSTTAVIAYVEVAPPIPPVARGTAEIPIETNLSLAKGLELRGHNPVLGSLHLGEALNVTLSWRATGPMSQTYEVQFDLVAEGQSTLTTSWTRSLVQGRFPNTAWQPNTTLGDWFHLPLPSEVTTGRYHLVITVTADNKPQGQPIHLTTISIEPDS